MHRCVCIVYIYTSTTETSAAIARISAQETVLGQEASTAVLMLLTTSNPLIELLLPKAVCSLTMVVLSFSKSEASHPCQL